MKSSIVHDIMPSCVTESDKGVGPLAGGKKGGNLELALYFVLGSKSQGAPYR